MANDMLVAIHAITVSDPSIAAVATGAWNSDGTPVMHKSSRTIPPGAFFPVSALQDGHEGALWLVEMRAASWPTESELRLFREERAK
jgi:hypothetical protein